jgi:hypothetical protein
MERLNRHCLRNGQRAVRVEKIRFGARLGSRVFGEQWSLVLEQAISPREIDSLASREARCECAHMTSVSSIAHPVPHLLYGAVIEADADQAQILAELAALTPGTFPND